MSKPKIAFYWCASCGGCEEAIVDLAEDILDLLECVDLVFWPCAMDFKKTDVEALPDRAILATLLNGAIRTSEQEEMARLLRRKSEYLIAFGACAQSGGIPGLANQFSREEILDYCYKGCPTVVNSKHVRPQTHCADDGRDLTLPELRQLVRSLDQVVEVDYYLPGCPPTPQIVETALTALLEGPLPPKGAVLAPDVALCDQCPLKMSKPTDLSIRAFHRPHEVIPDPEVCLLAQGLLCLGPATRAGCEALCIRGGMPCSGCFGPVTRVHDQGAKILSFLCSNIAPKKEEDIDEVLAGIPDPVGTFYRYGLPKSLLRRKAPPAPRGRGRRSG